MPESKNLNWLKDYDSQSPEAESAELGAGDAAANDADGWQQYRRWVTSAPAPSKRRVGIDPTLYNWRSYRNWTDEVKRSWPGDDEE